jgi:hypothetical protein
MPHQLLQRGEHPPSGDAPNVATATLTPVAYGGKPAYNAGFTATHWLLCASVVLFFNEPQRRRGREVKAKIIRNIEMQRCK